MEPVPKGWWCKSTAEPSLAMTITLIIQSSQLSKWRLYSHWCWLEFHSIPSEYCCGHINLPNEKQNNVVRQGLQTSFTCSLSLSGATLYWILHQRPALASEMSWYEYTATYFFPNFKSYLILTFMPDAVQMAFIWTLHFHVVIFSSEQAFTWDMEIYWKMIFQVVQHFRSHHLVTQLKKLFSYANEVGTNKSCH